MYIQLKLYFIAPKEFITFHYIYTYTYIYISAQTDSSYWPQGININELYLHTKLAQTATGETWRGKWQGNEIAAKILAVREGTPRISRDFNNEYPKLRWAVKGLLTIPRGQFFKTSVGANFVRRRQLCA
jgi:hypothetical protein